METQKSVISFAKERYASETAADHIRHLVEETAELCVASGLITLDDAITVMKNVWTHINHLPKAPTHIASGIADVQIMLYNVAEDNGMDVQQCTNDKMQKNRVG
jgi:hypothetical protein